MFKIENELYILRKQKSEVLLISNDADKKTTLAAIVEALKAYELESVDETQIQKALDNPGEELVIAKTKPVAPTVSVMVATDTLSATVTVASPPDARPVTDADIRTALENAHVSYGIDENAIAELITGSALKITVARGTPSEDGKNASIRQIFDLSGTGRPQEKEHGRVDYRDLNLFTKIDADTLIAEKIPATPGIPGTNIFGQPLPTKPGKDMPMPAGKNTRVEENKLFSTIAGQLYDAGGKLTVTPVIEIASDVDFSTGNIDFTGDVVIRGSVSEGFSVKAKGNVEIKGTVSGGTVEGNNVIVRSGIQGQHKGYIKAEQDITSKFIENATVIAGRDVLINDIILHSKVTAGSKIVLSGKGLIIGGQVSAGEEIRAKVIGSQLGAATEIAVGVNPRLREEYQTLSLDLRKNTPILDQTQKAVNLLKSMPGAAMNAQKQEMLLRSTKTMYHLMGQMEAARRRIEEIDVELENMRNGRIKASDAVYPGVKIIVGTLSKIINAEQKFCTFYEEDGEIKTGSFK